MTCPNCKIELLCPCKSCSKSRKKSQQESQHKDALTWTTDGDLMGCPVCGFKDHADVWQDHDMEEAEYKKDTQKQKYFCFSTPTGAKNGFIDRIKQAKEWGENKGIMIRQEATFWTDCCGLRDSDEIIIPLENAKRHWIESQVNVETQELTKNKKDDMGPETEKTMSESEKLQKIKSTQAEIRQIIADAMIEAKEKAEELIEDILQPSTLLEVTDEFDDRHFGLTGGHLGVEDNGDLKVLIQNGDDNSTRYFMVDEITQLFGQQFAPLNMPDTDDEAVKGGTSPYPDKVFPYPSENANGPEIVNPYPDKPPGNQPSKPEKEKFEDFPYEG